MESPWLIAISRQAALQRDMDAVANNIANANTPGYKAERMLFSEYLVRPQRNAPLSFVQDRGMMRDLREGPLTKTGNTLDLALTPNGPRYTRSGRFQLDADRRIVDERGEPVLGDAGQPISIPIDRNVITIAPDGTVSANTDGTVATDTAIVGKIGVVTFANPRSMKREAYGLYSSNAAPTPAPSTTRVMQGMLEQSNVNAIQEMTDMIEISRAYTANQQVLQNEDDRMKSAINKIIGNTA